MKAMRSYKFKLYRSKRNRRLDALVDLAGEIWNHCIALHRRYYGIYHKTLKTNELQKHITKLKRLPRYAHWNNLGSQAIQDITQRIGNAYDAFFDHVKKKKPGKKAPPRFRKRMKYKSFTLKQSGYKFIPGTNRVVIMGHEYKYSKSREFEGKVKTLTVKRNALGEFFIFVVCEVEMPEVLLRAGNAVGLDFGLKDFLTLDNGQRIESPLWYTSELKSLKSKNRAFSRCERKSNNRKRAYETLVRQHEKVANSRRDWFFKLAHELTSHYEIICIEDLNIGGMKRLWGRKVSDLAFAEFVKILEHVASQNGSDIIKIDRFAPSSKVCHLCGHIHESLSLRDRAWVCPSCESYLDRDINAAINIKRLGLLKVA